MTATRLIVRWLALVGMSFWLGGFTFYSAFVIPILHEELGGLDAGLVTGRVTVPLNALGVAAVSAWWLMAGLERSAASARARVARLVLLLATSLILAGLIALHPVMDARLESGSLRSFYRLHQVYLIASTVQWGVNLALLGVSVWAWHGTSEARLPQGRGD